MQLTEAKALGFENHHDRGVGHIDSNLNDRSGYKNLRFAIDELLHFSLFISRFHFAMYFAQSELWEYLFQNLVTLFKVLEVYLLAFLNQGEYNVNLSALMNLVAYAVV